MLLRDSGKTAGTGIGTMLPNLEFGKRLYICNTL